MENLIEVKATVEKSKVLLLVEGEKVEKELFQHFYYLYGIENVEIVAYKTHIYAFYNRLKKDYSDEEGNIDFEFIDLPLFLNDYLELDGADLLNEADFRDIILVFDFDPHDSQFDQNKLDILLDNFSDSTGRGKLYLNYPMIESFKNIESLEDPLFNKTTVHIDDLKKRYKGTSGYKQIVESTTCICNIEDIDTSIANALLKLHNNKLNYLLKNLSYEEESKYKLFCTVQCDKLEKESLIWVLNTSLLHMLEEYGYVK
ncbi:hypothetical protein ACQKMV_09395 [Lysinibacillus sp. NPDC094403]|uniref:hypothetical protein n=1 Tax=Lysinibacillus sp. NPDC094403 TaxID=3390581 RepID=UPI003CFFC68F